jgi:glycosyltransferase involved in cell wall biosynthesis
MNTVQRRQNKPNVSIVIPLYNKGKYIARSLDSIFSQTYQDFEVVVVDDGSTDNGSDIVTGYTDPRLRLIYQANAGPGEARNRGIQESTAPLLTFLDADDEWMPEFLEKSVQRLQDHPECALTIAGRFLGAERISWEPYCRAFGVTEGSWRMPTDIDARLMKLSIDFFHPGAVLCSREVIERFGGFYTKDSYNYGEDVYLWVQIAVNYKIYRDPVPLFWWHTEASDLSAYSSRKILPPPPMLTDPEPLRNGCPPEYRTLLECYLTYLALLAAKRCIRDEDFTTAKNLLSSYPVARTFIRDYARLQLDILLVSSPRLRYLLRKVKGFMRSLYRGDSFHQETSK